MAFEDLFGEGGVLQFAQRNRDSYALRSDHWTFIHIPKTAGSSFRGEIANALQPDFTIEVDYSSIDKQNDKADFYEKMHRAIGAYVGEGIKKKGPFVSGHFQYKDIAAYPEFSESRLLSMVRHPLERLRSDYLHRISPHTPLADVALRHYPTFRKFVEDKDNQDMMFRFLCKDETESVAETMEFIKHRYTFVGVQEMYTFSLKCVFMLLGMRVEPKIRLRVRPEDEKDKLKITQDDYRYIAESNARDFAIYGALCELLSDVPAKFYPLIDYGRIFRLMIDPPVAGGRP